jgi:hypothetical protein
MTDKHRFADKYVLLHSASPLLNRRRALVVDWWTNVVNKIQDKSHQLAYQYRQQHYRLPDDEKAVWVTVDKASYIVHDIEIDDEPVNWLLNSTSWQDSSIAVLIGCLDIIARRASGEPDESLAIDYHDTDYELHPDVCKVTGAIDGLQMKEAAIGQCVELAKDAMTECHSRNDFRGALQKIIDLLEHVM